MGCGIPSHVGAGAAMDRRGRSGFIARWLTVGAWEKRAVLFLGVWVIAVILCQLFLRIASDHYFLQFLPPLCLLTGLAFGRGLLIQLPHRRTRTVMLAVLGEITVFAVAKHPLMHSIYIIKDRLAGDTWAGRHAAPHRGRPQADATARRQALCRGISTRCLFPDWSRKPDALLLHRHAELHTRLARRLSLGRASRRDAREHSTAVPGSSWSRTAPFTMS